MQDHAVLHCHCIYVYIYLHVCSPRLHTLSCVCLHVNELHAEVRVQRDYKAKASYVQCTRDAVREMLLDSLSQSMEDFRQSVAVLHMYGGTYMYIPVHV